MRTSESPHERACERIVRHSARAIREVPGEADRAQRGSAMSIAIPRRRADLAPVVTAPFLKERLDAISIG
ncbi:hypothetical protein GCM10009609_61720 [Pseudonocardia aurantiaca]